MEFTVVLRDLQEELAQGRDISLSHATKSVVLVCAQYDDRRYASSGNELRLAG